METRLPFQQQKVCKLKITPPDHCKPMNIVNINFLLLETN